ncbi:MAG: gfo/Idh/MocA family oxidoreductase, partial [Lentisphaeria bacterium]|nr:gfo/Idh/MocA family oxidoreductase [Lentisphaeria bacterium]
MSKIKVGQIGVSHEHAGGKMKSLRLRPDLFDIVGVVDDSATAAAKFAGQDMSPYSGLRFLTEEELLQT